MGREKGEVNSQGKTVVNLFKAEIYDFSKSGNSKFGHMNLQAISTSPSQHESFFVSLKRSNEVYLCLL